MGAELWSGFRLGDRWVRPEINKIDDTRVDAKAMEVLVALAELSPSVVSASALLERVWPNVVVVDNVVYQAIAQLRKALGDTRRSSRYIECISRRGYRLIAPIRAETNGVGEPHRGERPPIRSIAILPLHDISVGADAYFADGLTETLIVELSKLPRLRVISRTSVMQFKGTRMSLTEIAKTLNVEGIIEGSVLRAEEQVRVTMQLIDARDDRHLWAQQYDRDATRVLEIHTEVANAVAEQISLLLTPQEASRLTPAKQVDPRAQAAYFRGLAERSLPLEAETIQRAIGAFEEAIEIAPDWAPPNAALATSIYMYGRIRNSRRVSGHLRARQLARRAIELDPSCGEAHSALGSGLYGYDWDWDSAERELRCGLELGNILWGLYPQLLMSLGRTDEAIAQADARVAAAPLDLYIRAERCMILFHVGHFERARLEAQEILASEPNYLIVAIFLLFTNIVLGRMDDASAVYARFARDGLTSAELAQLTRGDAEPMWRWLQQTHPARFWNAFGWLMSGDNDRAIAALKVGFKEREYEMICLHDAWLAPLHSDPRFVRDMNLPPVGKLI